MSHGDAVTEIPEASIIGDSVELPFLAMEILRKASTSVNYPEVHYLYVVIS